MYILDGQEIRRPHTMSEMNSTQMVQHRTLDGAVNRDHFGGNRRVWELQYRNVKKSDYETIFFIYDDYLAATVVRSWEITETNYDIDETFVHIDLVERGFTVRGTDYLSDFDLILTEA